MIALLIVVAVFFFLVWAVPAALDRRFPEKAVLEAPPVREFQGSPVIEEIRTEKDGERCTDYELTYFNKNMCPDCGHDGFLSGPRGGGCQNVKCANKECGSCFNFMGVFGVDRISDAQPDKPASTETSEVCR